MQAIKVYIRMLRIQVLCGLQYKGWWLMIFQVFVVVFTDPLPTLLLFQRFGSIGAWDLPRIMLIYALAVAAFGLAESLFRGFDYFPFHMVQNGGLDRLLLRPQPLTVQTAASFFHLHRLARAVSGLGCIAWALNSQGVRMTLHNSLLLLSALVGGVMTYGGVFVLTSGLSFFTVKGVDWIYIFTNASYQVTRCPWGYAPRMLKSLFTFVMPMFLISYYPASVLCGWGEAAWKGWLSLPAGGAFLLAAYGVWRIGVRHYTSTGS